MRKWGITLVIMGVIFSSIGIPMGALANETGKVTDDVDVYDIEGLVCKGGKAFNSKGELVDVKDDLGYLACSSDDEPQYDLITKPSDGYTKPDMSDQGSDSGLVGDTGWDGDESSDTISASSLSIVLAHSDTVTIPEFTIEVRNNSTGEKATKQVKAKDYSEDGLNYTLKISDFKYSTGDKIQIKVTDFGKFTKQVNLNIGSRVYALTKERPSAYYSVKTYKTIIEEGSSTTVNYLIGMEKHPIDGSIALNSSYIHFTIKDNEGKPLKDTTVVFQKSPDGKKETLKTDSNGQVYVPKDVVDDYYQVTPEGYDTTEQYKPFTGDDSVDSGFIGKEELYFTKDRVSTDKAENDKLIEESSNANFITYKLKFSFDADTRITSDWIQADLLFAETDKKTNVTGKQLQVVVPSNYTLKDVTSKYAEVLDYKINGDTLTIKLKPLYTVEIWNNGEAYDVTLSNVKPPITLKGKEKITFGVMPNTTVVVKNNTTGKATNLRANDKNKNIEMNMKYGVTKGSNASAPHTNVWVYMWTVLLILTVLGVFTYWKYLNNKDKKKIMKNGTFLLVILSLLGSSLAPIAVQADVVGDGGNGTGNGNSPMPANILNYTSNRAIIEVYFVASSSLNEQFYSLDGDIGTLQNPEKFSVSYRQNAIYFAPDMASMNAASINNSGVVRFDEAAPVNNRFKVINGLNAMVLLLKKVQPSTSSNLSDPASGATSLQNFKKRLVSPSTAVKGQQATGTGAEFINAIHGGLREGSSRTSANGSSYPLSGANGNASAGVSPYGEAVSNYLRKTYVGEDDAKTEKRKQLFESYLDYLDAKDIAKRDSSFSTSLSQAFYQGKAVMMINTLTGITLSNGVSGTEFAFMALHDVLNWYKWIGKNYRVWQNNGKASVIGNLTPYKERAMIVKIKEGWYLVPPTNATDTFKKNGTIQHTFPEWAYSYYSKTIRPSNNKLPSTDNPSQNPFGAWGYMYFGGKIEPSATPRLAVKIDYVNETGSKVKSGNASGWFYSDNRTFLSLMSSGDSRIAYEETFKVGEKAYEVDKEGQYSVTTIDVPNEKNACTITGGEELTKSTAPNGGNKFQGKLASDVSGGNLKASNYLVFTFVHSYLGGKSASADIVSKYKKENIDELGECYGDALMTITLPVKELETEAESDLLVIPQWSLSRYFEDIATPRSDKANIGKGGLKLYFIFSADGITKLSPSDISYSAKITQPSYILDLVYKDIVKEYKKLWFIDYPSIMKNGAGPMQEYSNTLNPSSTSSSPSYLTQKIEVESRMDVIAVKTRKDLKISGLAGETIDSLQLADWVEENQSLGDGLSFESPFSKDNKGLRIPLDKKPYTSLEKHTEKKVSIDIEQELESRIKTYSVYQIAKYTGQSCGFNGCYPVTRTKTSTTDMKLEPIKANLKGNFKFDKYSPVDSVAVTTIATDEPILATSAFSTTKVTKESNRKIKLYPEVAMLVEDKDFVASINYAIGEKKREVTPNIFQHVFLQIKDGKQKIEVEAGVTGAEATGKNVEGLLNVVKGNPSNAGIVRPVLNKGTTTTNSIQLHDAEIVYEIFNLEYREERLKKEWVADGGTVPEEYNTQKLRDKLKNLVIINGEGGGKITKGDTNSYYFVSDKKYENVKKDTIFKVNRTEIDEYDIVIRGGYLESIGDYTYTDLKEYFNSPEKCEYKTALTYDEKRTLACGMMKMFVVPKWKDATKGVFYVLEKEKGNKITKNDDGTNEEYVSLANMMRGVESEPDLSAVKQKIDKAWYMEDTTAFKLEIERVYYEIPSILWTAKMPIEYADPALKTPQDMNQFYSKGVASNIGTVVHWGNDALELTFEINTGKLPFKGVSQQASNIITRSPYDYVTPNVSVLDALQ